MQYSVYSFLANDAYIEKRKYAVLKYQKRNRNKNYKGVETTTITFTKYPL